MRKLLLAPAGLWLLVSCKGFPLMGRPEVTGAQPPAQAQVELQDIRFDGKALAGRLLVRAVEHDLRLDKRLIESIYLTTESVSDCATGQPLAFVVMDVYARPPSEDDILLLAPGYWYGKDISVPLFTENLHGPSGPACIEAEFAFRALGGETAAHLRVRAERPPPPSPDAGTPLDAGMSVDDVPNEGQPM